MNVISKESVCKSKRLFSSLGAMLREVQDESKYNVELHQRKSRATDNYTAQFTMTKNIDEAIRLATKGWHKGLDASLALYKQYGKVFEEYFPKQDYGSEMIHDVSGEYVDIERAITGIPENMYRFVDSTEIITKGAKMQRIICECACSGGLSEEQIFYRGAMLTALINSMESAGFRVELVCRAANGLNFGVHYCYDCIIKQFDENPDLNKIAFCLAHPSFFRRLVFSLNEQESVELIRMFGFIRNSGYGGANYGYPHDLRPNELWFPALDYSFGNQSFENLSKMFIDVLNKHFNETTITE